jgi:hypothetical protein
LQGCDRLRGFVRSPAALRISQTLSGESKFRQHIRENYPLASSRNSFKKSSPLLLGEIAATKFASHSAKYLIELRQNLIAEIEGVAVDVGLAILAFKGELNARGLSHKFIHFFEPFADLREFRFPCKREVQVLRKTIVPEVAAFERGTALSAALPLTSRVQQF